MRIRHEEPPRRAAAARKFLPASAYGRRLFISAMTDKRRDDVCGTRRPPDHNPKAWRKWDRALQRYIGSESGAQRVQSQPPFCCPVCGAVKYVRVFVRRRSGDWYQAQDAVQRCLFVAEIWSLTCHTASSPIWRRSPKEALRTFCLFNRRSVYVA